MKTLDTEVIGNGRDTDWRKSELVRRYIMLSKAEMVEGSNCRAEGRPSLARDHDLAAIGAAAAAARVAAEEVYLRTGSYKNALEIASRTLQGIIEGLNSNVN